jgi:uncharacterized membrane protein YgcG
MRKIALLLVCLASFGFSAVNAYDVCPDVYYVGDKRYVKTLEFYIQLSQVYPYHYLYDSYCTKTDLHPTVATSRYFEFLYSDGGSPEYHFYHVTETVVHYIYEPEPESDDNITDDDNGTCDAPGQYDDPSRDLCVDCSAYSSYAPDVGTPKCLCEAAGYSYNNAHTETSLGTLEAGGKCYAKRLSNCDSGEQFDYYIEIPCGDTNSTNPDNNTTNPDTNGTNPDNNGSNPGGGSDGGGGDGGGGSSIDEGDDCTGLNSCQISEGDNVTNSDGNGTNPGGGGGGFPNDNTTNGTNPDDNGTCAEGEDCCTGFWCSDDKTADPSKAFDALQNEWSSVYNSYNELKNLVNNGFTLSVPSGSYDAPSTNYHGQVVTFNVCSSFGMFAPIIQFMVTVLGFIVTLKIYFWRL